jgi:hypothetical protein
MPVIREPRGRGIGEEEHEQMQVEPAGPSTGELSAVSGATPVTEMSPPPSTYLAGTLDGISSSLSMSSDTLRGALRTGSSLAQVAQQQGVSRSDLLKTVEAEMQQRRSARGAAPIDQTALDRIANRAIDRGRGGPASPAGADPTTSQVERDLPGNGVDAWA